NWMVIVALLLGAAAMATPTRAQDLAPLKYNNPGLVVDLGVGLWATPLPMDYDGDGKMDLVVVSAGKPSNGTFFFKNAGGAGKMPVFKAPMRIDAGQQNIQVSYV